MAAVMVIAIIAMASPATVGANNRICNIVSGDARLSVARGTKNGDGILTHAMFRHRDTNAYTKTGSHMVVAMEVILQLVRSRASIATRIGHAAAQTITGK